MKNGETLSINNTLVQGICNYSCITCGVNKPSFTGPKQYQSRETTAILAERMVDFISNEKRIRYLGNSGYGEPTLHPEFFGSMDIFGRFLEKMVRLGLPFPEIGIVTNGSRLYEPGVVESVAENIHTLKISFPTPEPDHYGALMLMNQEEGKEMLEKVALGIEKAMSFNRDGRLANLRFHISPPHNEYTTKDFPRTVDFLTKLANKNGLGEIELVIPKKTSNRTGLIQGIAVQRHNFKDYFARFNGRSTNGVNVSMVYTGSNAFRNIWGMFDVIKNYNFPCLYNGTTLFITADGKSGCANDQNAMVSHGDILRSSIEEIMDSKRSFVPSKTCERCNIAPNKIRGVDASIFYRILAILKVYYVLKIRRRSLH